MNKINAITLSATSPLGRQTIGGGQTQLRDFDLIVITGPNGSGKTTLAAALADVPNGVQVASPDGSPAELDGKADIEVKLLKRSGADLMGPFASLGDALAAASGMARIREERSLLSRLISDRTNAPDKLANLMPTAASAQDAEIGRKIADYLEVEERAVAAIGIDRPLTLGTFNEIGREVAERLRLTWREPTTVSDEAMRAAEDAVRPEARVIVGDVAVRNAIDTALAGLATSGASQVIKKVKDAEDALQDAIQKAATLAPLAPDESAPSSEQWPARCERLADVDDKQVGTLNEERGSLDMLGTIRKQAEQWLSQHESDDCPVCKGRIDRDRLLAELRAAAGASERIDEIDVEIGKLTDQASTRRRAAQAIKGCIETVTQAQRGVVVLLKQWSDAIDALKTACMPASGWDAEIVVSANGVREACEKCLASAHWSGSGVEAVNGAVAIVGDLVAAIKAVKKTREDTEKTAKANLAPAESAFGRLRPLRELLVARQELNAASWEPRWESEITDGLKREVIGRWETAVKELVAELEAAEGEAQQRILGDEQVKERFRSLCAAARHPLLRNAVVSEDSVKSGGEDIDTEGDVRRKRLPQLSEGYRVIVNLAAFIAVSGHVCDGQQHQAGWIVLDEPTNALDAKNRSEVAKYLGGLSTELMPRQMFITTFEQDFVTELLEAAKQSGRRTLVIELPEWTGAVPVTPTVTPR